MSHSKRPKKIILLGSTGSIGRNTLEVVRRHPGRFQIVALAAGRNAELLMEQAKEFRPKTLFIRDKVDALQLRRRAGLTAMRVFCEADGLDKVIETTDADILVAATSGIEALLPVITFLKKGKRVALANKEILVAAGALITETLRRHPKSELIPVDSEHSAIFQCLSGESREGIGKIILTGSGGPLRSVDAKKFPTITKAEVTRHPKWNMGQKITVDSATLMNKGLEVIEASWLFGIKPRSIQVLIHPEAVVHSMVEFRDGSVIAQLGVTDMKLPIQYALTYPDRWHSGQAMHLSLKDLSRLTFEEPDRRKFPCLELAYRAVEADEAMPVALIAADEVAVRAYLDDRISFCKIAEVIEKVMSRHPKARVMKYSDILHSYQWAESEAKKLCGIC